MGVRKLRLNLLTGMVVAFVFPKVESLALGCAEECSLVEGELLDEAGNRAAWVAGKESGSLVPVPWWPVGPPVGNVFDCVGGAGGLG